MVRNFVQLSYIHLNQKTYAIISSCSLQYVALQPIFHLQLKLELSLVEVSYLVSLDVHASSDDSIQYSGNPLEYAFITDLVARISQLNLS